MAAVTARDGARLASRKSARSPSSQNLQPTAPTRRVARAAAARYAPLSITEKLTPFGGDGPERNDVSCAGLETPIPSTATSQSPVPQSAPCRATVDRHCTVTLTPAADSCCCASSIAGVIETPASVGKMIFRLGDV